MPGKVDRLGFGLRSLRERVRMKHLAFAAAVLGGLSLVGAVDRFASTFFGKPERECIDRHACLRFHGMALFELELLISGPPRRRLRGASRPWLRRRRKSLDRKNRRLQVIPLSLCPPSRNVRGHYLAAATIKSSQSCSYHVREVGALIVATNPIPYFPSTATYALTAVREFASAPTGCDESQGLGKCGPERACRRVSERKPGQLLTAHKRKMRRASPPQRTFGRCVAA